MLKSVMAALLLLVLTAPPEARASDQRHQCELDGAIYLQPEPCDDPSGFVYQQRQQQEVDRQRAAAAQTASQAAAQWRPVEGAEMHRVIGMAEAYLQRQMRDPGSFRVERRHTRVMENSSGYQVTMTYRARNGFGGMSVETAAVFLDRNMRGREVVRLD